jgi:hypothetical protein
MKKLLILCVALTIGSAALAQTDTASKDVIVVEAIFYNGELIPSGTLQTVTITCVMTETQKKRMAEYFKLRNAVYVTYPYARTAGVLLNDITAKSENMSRRERKAYVRSRESELRREFTKPITKMSTFQGKVLMKLINRETGNSCYEIIKDYKGGFMATTYQSVAFFFNTSLKQSYEATGDDVVMERLVKDVQKLYGYSEIAKR